jgi:hypothetical protein
MTKSQINNSHKEKAMEFKNTDEVVIVEEKNTTVFEAKQVINEPTAEQKKEASRRWIESFSDCA